MTRAMTFGALLLLGCANPDVQVSPQRQCAPLAGWSEVARESAGKYLIFGETHGTRESPHTVQEFVCQVASEPVLLGIELSSTQNENLQRAWATRGDFLSALRAELPGVFGVREDGVASRAMLEMLVRLHALRRAGSDIDVVAFNGAKDDEQTQRFAHLPGQGPHEAAQAENIRAAASVRDYRHVVILVGSLHAQKAPVSIGGIQFAPMATQLARPEDVISLEMEDSGGSAWNCVLKVDPQSLDRPITKQDVDCSAHEQRSNGLSRGEPSMALSRKTSFDGYYFVGEVSASPPPRP